MKKRDSAPLLVQLLMTPVTSPAARAAALALPFAWACNGETAPAIPDAVVDGGGASGSSGDSGGAASGKRTLENCGGTVGAGVPEFFSTYFACADLALSGTDVTITTKGLPPYDTYYYGSSSPNYAPFDSTRGAMYRANPNTLKEQKVTFKIPVAPARRAGVTVTAMLVDGVAGGPTSTYDYKMGAAGVGINGVLLFNPLAAPGDDIENEKYTFDDYDAHPEMRGAYHYHTTSKGPLAVLTKRGLATSATPGSADVELYGIMCDGTPILGCTELDASAPTRTDLDAQNGHTHDLKSKAGATLLAGRYHIHMCPSKWTDHPRKFTPEVQLHDRCDVTGG